MLRKITGFALVNKDEKYLCLEQISDVGIEIYSSPNVNDCTLYNTHFEAHQEGYNIKFGTGIWDYIYEETDVPVEVVKVTMVIDIKSSGKIGKPSESDKHKK